MKPWLLSLILALLAAPVIAQDKITFSIAGPKDAGKNVPIRVPLSLAAQHAKANLAQVTIEGATLQGQLTAPGLATQKIKATAPDLHRRDLHFILPIAAAGKTLSGSVVLQSGSSPEQFAWKRDSKNHADLVFVSGGKERPVLRYMHQAYDDSNPEIRNKTYKVFHHVYNPAGTRLVTNGGHTLENTDPKNLKYPHHRGIMLGFNKCSYGPEFKKKADVWHCQKDDHQLHEAFTNEEAGPVLGRHRVLISWHGAGKETFAAEEREITVYNVPGGTLIEVADLVIPTQGPVKLDGDPQHAGFQFRAHNDVAAATAKQTYYLRPDGKGNPGETRNWPMNKEHVNLPWNAMSFVLDKDRYSVAYLDHPSNPRETRHSERDYGRFGCYFEYEMTPEKPLVLNHRLWLQDGEITKEQVEALYSQFTNGAK